MVFWSILSVIFLIIGFLVDCGSWRLIRKWGLSWWDKEEWVEYIFAAIFFGALVTLVTFFFTVNAGGKKEIYVYDSRTVQLSALGNRNDQVYYAGFLGSGGGDSKQRIAYITKEKNGFQKLCKVDSSKALIKEGNVEPKLVIEKQGHKVTNGLWDRLNFRHNHTRLFKYPCSDGYKFYVPKNTINKQFKLDANNK